MATLAAWDVMQRDGPWDQSMHVQTKEFMKNEAIGLGPILQMIRELAMNHNYDKTVSQHMEEMIEEILTYHTDWSNDWPQINESLDHVATKLMAKIAKE